MEYITSLDIILEQINEPTLTTSEVETIKPIDPDSMQEKYDILFTVLQNRGSIGNSIQKLENNAGIMNIVINEPKKNYSNILYGGSVEFNN
jgi:hypothetical protein